MAKVEFRKPINALLAQKTELQNQLTTAQDELNLAIEKHRKLREDETAYRMSLEALPKTASHKPAREVFDRDLGTVRYAIQEQMKVVEELEKRKDSLASKVNSLETSIRSLSN